MNLALLRKLLTAKPSLLVMGSEGFLGGEMTRIFQRPGWKRKIRWGRIRWRRISYMTSGLGIMFLLGIFVIFLL
jgi:hypothetical protein